MEKILITGCSSGFGFDTAKYLAQKGYHVFASMRNIAGKNLKAATDLENFGKSNGYKLDVIELDVTSNESVNYAAEQLPVIDVLINNAGMGWGGPTESFSADEVLAQLDLNIVGTLRCAKAVLPGMRAQRSGLIIQTSSIAGRCAFPGLGVYHASKWGLEGLSETLRYELAPLGIDVSLVEPGPFSTDFMQNVITPSDTELAAEYKHVNEFFEGFTNQVQGLYMDENAPTDPMLVVEAYEKLIKLPAGKRPLRTMVGLDFGFQALNDATEPIRKAGLESMGLEKFDGAIVRETH